MITSFLFYNKLLDSRGKKFDWLAFFIGRFFRLTPLYLAAMAGLLVIVAVLSKGVLYDSGRYLTKVVAEWLTFTIIGAPDINRIAAERILAGVTWSLPYEWVFYCSLPLLAVFAKQRVNRFLLLFAVAALLFGIYLHMKFNIAVMFGGGILAAVLNRNKRFVGFAKTGSASVLALAALTAVIFFPTAYGAAPLFLLTTAFCLIANGTNLFGALLWNVSRRLGDLAYSIYLLHGILLFTALNFFIGKGVVAEMSPLHYWLTIAALVPFLLALSTFTFRYIEQPGIAMTRFAMQRIHNRKKLLVPA